MHILSLLGFLVKKIDLCNQIPYLQRFQERSNRLSALKINYLFAVLHLDEARIEYRVLMAAKTFFLEGEIICMNITAATREKVAVIIFVKTQNVR